MMIKIFIVTYKCPSLNDNLKSLFESDASPDSYTVDIIVNHPDFEIKDEYRDRVTIHMQSLRDLNSRGFLSRDWNHALIMGFGDLLNPHAKQVILCQDDMLWHKDWQKRLRVIHRKYNFYSCSWGDGFMSFTRTAILRVGLFDERFCLITLHEADYFLRHWLYNRQYASINDSHHGRVLNPTVDVATRIDKDKHVRARKTDIKHSRATLHIWRKKWPGVRYRAWDKKWFEKHENLSISAIPNYMFYPHFEGAIRANRLRLMGYSIYGT